MLLSMPLFSPPITRHILPKKDTRQLLQRWLSPFGDLVQLSPPVKLRRRGVDLRLGAHGGNENIVNGNGSLVPDGSAEAVRSVLRSLIQRDLDSFYPHRLIAPIFCRRRPSLASSAFLMNSPPPGERYVPDAVYPSALWEN